MMLNETQTPAGANAEKGRGERGAAEGFMLIMMVVLVAFAGLAYDAGMAFNARREATNIAGAAARAGANVVSKDVLYGDGQVRIKPEGSGVASDFAYGAGAEAVLTDRTDTTMRVVVSMSHSTVFLSVVGIDQFTVDGESTAFVEGRSP